MKNQSESDIKKVFIIGAGRSGTKFLRDILGKSDDVSIVPYDVGYVWRYGNENSTHDELTSNMINDKIRHYIQSTLPTLCASSDNRSSPKMMIEKSVPNALRVEFVHALFPDAKFIHLIRDGRAVTESSIRLWQSPSEKGYLLKKLRYFPWKNYRYAFWYVSNMILGKISGRGQKSWGPRYLGIDEDIDTLPLSVVCARQWRKCVEAANKQLAKLDGSSVLEVRYEELMQDENVLLSVCEFLGINDKKSVLSHFRASVNQSNTEKWRGNLSTDTLKLILEETRLTNEKLGYKL